jgi:pimeloyl-ACP methyl ester carboxylesterase
MTTAGPSSKQSRSRWARARQSLRKLAAGVRRGLRCVERYARCFHLWRRTRAGSKQIEVRRIPTPAIERLPYPEKEDDFMAKLNRTHVSDIRGAIRMGFDATTGIVDVVERMHSTIQRTPAPLGKPVNDPTRGITGFVYRSVRGVARLFGQGIDGSLAAVERLLPEGDRAPVLAAALAAANGVHGDYLVRTGNPLAIEMSLRHHGVPIDLTDPASSLGAAGGRPSDKLLVLVHGLCMNDLQWRRNGHDHGEALACELGFSPLYLRYNSGLHVAQNGRNFAELLETLVARWPGPLRELTIIGHSMGGLVTRSACHFAGEHGHAWLKHLRNLVFLGTPHHGAPLERGGHGLDYVMELSPYSAPLARLGKARSVGIQDLRHGNITAGKHEFVPLPAGVNAYVAAATLGSRRSVVAERLTGDGLVPLDSALGRDPDPSRCLGIPQSRQWIAYGMGHLELLANPEVCARLRTWLKDAENRPATDARSRVRSRSAA